MLKRFINVFPYTLSIERYNNGNDNDNVNGNDNNNNDNDSHNDSANIQL